MGVERRQVLRAALGEHVAQDVELRPVEGVGVVAPDRLDVVAAQTGQDERRSVQVRRRLRGRQGTALARAGELPAVMREPDVVGAQVPPGPVEPRQLAVAAVVGGNRVPRVVALVARDRWLSGGSHLHGQIHGIWRHPIGFVRRDSNSDFHKLLPRPPGQRLERAHEDAQVEREARVPHVEELEHLAVAVLPGGVVPVRDLPPAGDAGLAGEELPLAVPELEQFLVRNGAGPNHG